MELFGVDIDIDEYSKKLEGLHREAEEEGFDYKEVIERAEEELTEEEFTAFQCALLRGCLQDGQKLDDLAHYARRAKQKKEADN